IRDLYVTGVQTCALPICRDRLLADAVAEDDRLEALALLTALYDRETPMVSDLAGSGRLDQVTDPDVAHCWSWTAAWIAAAKQERSEERRVGKEGRTGSTQ